jgi:hypothetical protein
VKSDEQSSVKSCTEVISGSSSCTPCTVRFENGFAACSLVLRAFTFQLFTLITQKHEQHRRSVVEAQCML